MLAKAGFGASLLGAWQGYAWNARRTHEAELDRREANARVIRQDFYVGSTMDVMRSVASAAEGCVWRQMNASFAPPFERLWTACRRRTHGSFLSRARCWCV